MKLIRVLFSFIVFVLCVTVATTYLWMLWGWSAVTRASDTVRRRRAGHARAFWTSWLWRVVSVILGIRLVVRARHADRDIPRLGVPVLTVSNHQSSLDIVILVKVLADLGYRDTRWIAKSSLRHVPFIGHSMQMDGSALIDRDGGDGDLKKIMECGDRARIDDATVVLFPEGRRFTSRRKKAGYVHVLPPRKKGFTALLNHLDDDCRILSMTLHWVGMSEAKNWLGTALGVVGKRIMVEWEIVDVDASADDWLEGEWKRKDLRLDSLGRAA